MAAEVAAPLSQAKKITMVSSGKGDVGVSKLTNEVFDVMSKLPHVVEGMTGVDISKVTRRSRKITAAMFPNCCSSQTFIPLPPIHCFAVSKSACQLVV